MMRSLTPKMNLYIDKRPVTMKKKTKGILEVRNVQRKRAKTNKPGKNSRDTDRNLMNSGWTHVKVRFFILYQWKLKSQTHLKKKRLKN